jgi:hypothetical protein
MAGDNEAEVAQALVDLVETVAANGERVNEGLSAIRDLLAGRDAELSQALTDIVETLQKTAAGSARVVNAIGEVVVVLKDKGASAPVAEAISALRQELRAIRPAPTQEYDLVTEVAYDQDGRIKATRTRRVPAKKT